MKKIKNTSKVIILECILLTIILINLLFQNKLVPTTLNIINNPNKWADYPICDTLLINTYLNDIQNASNEFYSDKYYSLPIVSWYVITVKEVKANDINALNPVIQITFNVSPYLGAHNTVANDTVTFEASYTGEILQLDYKQNETFDLPNHLNHLIK